MTVSAAPPSFSLHNQQTFETCIALTLQAVAAVEFGAVLSPVRLSGPVLVEFAEQVERHAGDVAALAGEWGLDLSGLGAGYYHQLAAGRDEPLQAAYHGLHAAAFLGLAGGATTAMLLSMVGYALRVLAGAEDRVCH
ncbi:hypothetical protein [Deinococcus sp. Arct2-2]|uniref:hypothetical protein n=1 Tax=Deinococcus sp. Arct2-2 TaxID=2568653 RepID=UPI001F0EF87B|nr:hypothetical protein [Deinococcus sp. Arct2-2]